MELHLRLMPPGLISIYQTTASMICSIIDRQRQKMFSKPVCTCFAHFPRLAFEYIDRTELGVVYNGSRPSLCKSMHSYDAIIDLSDRDTSKQDKPHEAGVLQ